MNNSPHIRRWPGRRKTRPRARCSTWGHLRRRSLRRLPRGNRHRRSARSNRRQLRSCSYRRTPNRPRRRTIGPIHPHSRSRRHCRHRPGNYCPRTLPLRALHSSRRPPHTCSWPHSPWSPPGHSASPRSASSNPNRARRHTPDTSHRRSWFRCAAHNNRHRVSASAPESPSAGPRTGNYRCTPSARAIRTARPTPGCNRVHPCRRHRPRMPSCRSLSQRGPRNNRRPGSAWRLAADRMGSHWRSCRLLPRRRCRPMAPQRCSTRDRDHTHNLSTCCRRSWGPCGDCSNRRRELASASAPPRALPPYAAGIQRGSEGARHARCCALRTQQLS